MPAQREDACRKLTDGTGADDSCASGPIAVRGGPESPERLDDDGERLGERRLLERDVGGDPMHIPRARDEVRRIRTVMSDDADLPALAAADRLVAVALRALAAALDAFDDDAIAFAQVRHARTDSGNRPRGFVTRHDRV
jgi:hypothetical protein